MLKKLFVHEWKDCWRLVGLMNRNRTDIDRNSCYAE